MAKTEGIWCLFSIDNNYDQPEHNLVRYWTRKPSIEEVATYIYGKDAMSSDESIMKSVQMWKGQSTQRTLGDTAYRVQFVTEDDRLG